MQSNSKRRCSYLRPSINTDRRWPIACPSAAQRTASLREERRRGNTALPSNSCETGTDHPRRPPLALRRRRLCLARSSTALCQQQLQQQQQQRNNPRNNHSYQTIVRAAPGTFFIRYCVAPAGPHYVLHPHADLYAGSYPSSVLARPLQVTVRSMLRDRCTVCLSVTLVYCGQTVGWIKIPLGTEVRHSQGFIVLDGDPAPPTERGTAAPLPTFPAMSIVAKRSPISATAELVTFSGPR